MIQVLTDKHIFVNKGEFLVEAHGLKSVEITAEIQPMQMAKLLQQEEIVLPEPNQINDFDFQPLIQRLGLTAKVSLTLGERRVEWEAEVLRILGTMNAKTRTIGVVVGVQDPYNNIVLGKRPPLIQGMFCEVHLTASAIPERIVIPRTSWHKGKVYTVDEENRLRIIPAEMEFSQEDFVVIADGIEEGETVVASLLSPAVEGMLLETQAEPNLLKQMINQAESVSNSPMTHD